jgi:uncharacterized membrane protein HdeD (DUF308 family)
MHAMDQEKWDKYVGALRDMEPNLHVVEGTGELPMRTNRLRPTVSELESTIRHWWVFILLGAMFLALGALVFQNPIESYVGLAIYFAAAFVVSGAFRIGFALLNRRALGGWGWYLGAALLELSIGFFLLANPELAAVSLPIYVGFSLLFWGISAIGKAFDMRALGMRDWSVLLAAGIAGLGFSTMVIFNPSLGVASVIVWTGLAFLSIGAFNVYLGFRLHGSDRWLKRPHYPGKNPPSPPLEPLSV